MQIIIIDNKIIQLAQVFEQQEELIEKHFRVKDPNAHHMRSMKSGIWDGYHRYYKRSQQTLCRGYLKDIINLCVVNDLPYEIVDNRSKSKYPTPAPGSFDKHLIDAEINGKQISAHDHQMRCWESVCRSSTHPLFEVGTHFHPTGGGKSLMMAGIVKLLRCPTVIITEQSIVLNQITKSLKLFNVVHHDDIGEFYSGKMPEGNVVCVGSIAALNTPPKPIFGKFKVKMETLTRDFNALYEKDVEKLKSIVSQKGIMAWRRSEVIDRIKAKSSKNKNGKFDDIVPNGEWNNIIGDIIDNIGYLYENSKNKLIKIIGEEDVIIWGETLSVSKSYDKDLSRCFEIWYTYEKKKYFDITLKGYHTRVIRTRELQQMVSECELLMIDEMDNAASANYDDLFLKWFNGRYIHGFSGTPYDPDKPVEEMILRGRFGPIISKSTRKELEDIGQIQPVKYFMIQFGEHDPKDKTAFDVAERRIIIDNIDFQNMILKMTKNWPDERHLIIIDTTNVEDLGKTLNGIIPNSVFIYGKIAHKKRQEMISRFENGDINVLIVSKVGKRGMDLGGGAHNMYIIGGGKNYSNFDQMIGRGVRKNDRGWARVFDFYYTGNHYLLKHSRRRLNFIIEMGYQAKILFGKTPIDAKKFVSSRYKIPKELMVKLT